MYGAQKQALLFREHEEGLHTLNRLAFNTDKDDEVRRLLAESGIDKNRVTRMLFATPELDNRERDALEQVEDLKVPVTESLPDGLERD